MKNKKAKKLRNRAILILVIALTAAVVYIIRNSYTPYDYAHLIPIVDNGAGSAFVPLAVSQEIEGMQAAAETSTLILFVDTEEATIAVYDKRNGQTWYACPPGYEEDSKANASEKGIMRSLVGFRYYDETKRRLTRWSYTNAVDNDQFEVESIPDGVRVTFMVGDLTMGIDACPRYISEERFNERVLANLGEDEAKWLKRMYIPSRSREGFMELPSGTRTHAINSERIIRMFDSIGYTLEELEEDNAAAEYEFEIDQTYFTLVVEYVLRGSELVVNVPLSEVVSYGADNRLYTLDLMRYFGAGGNDEEGYLLVPSGSGALINFNNGKVNEETYVDYAYGYDPLLNSWMPQQVSSVRLPLLGIKKDGAAMLAYVENGSGIASINADVAGKLSDYNSAWFSFMIRDFSQLSAEVVSELDLVVVSPCAYEGDITVNYLFLDSENADYTGMALAYQQALVNKGILTPLAPADNTPFYVDILGAVEKTKFILGTPYTALESMTTYDQAGEILDVLNNNGVHSVQMQWIGWFNRGYNHDVAKKIRWIGANGSKNDMRDLQARLQADGGNLFPAVNFGLTSYYSKGLDETNEVSRSPAGYLGSRSGYRREFLNFMGGPGGNSWYYLVAPTSIPMHVSKFISAFNKLSIDALSLMDMGDFLASNSYRKNPVDRESSRLISMEQMALIKDQYASLMVYGGNDYALAAADHIVNAPMEMDRYYILDEQIPFYQTVIHGYIDYTGTAINTRELQDTRRSFLNALETGAALHYEWTYQPTRALEFTAYERLYSTHYVNWIDEAVDLYNEYNEIYKTLRTQRIVGHQILVENPSFTSSVTVTEYEDGTRVYVNTQDIAYDADGLHVPALGYYVERSQP